MNKAVLVIGKLNMLAIKSCYIKDKTPLEIAGIEMIPLWSVNCFTLTNAVNTVFRKCTGFTHIDASVLRII